MLQDVGQCMVGEHNNCKGWIVLNYGAFVRDLEHVSFVEDGKETEND